MDIKHFVFSGGGAMFILNQLVVLEELDKNKLIKRENIETIYSTSAGCIVALLYSLNIELSILIEYFKNRPWHEVFNIKAKNLLEINNKKGLFSDNEHRKIFKPLFDLKDIPLNITLNDYYNICKIEFNFIVFELNEFKTVIINHKNYPDLELLTAMTMSCAVPILTTPFFIENKCFVDGGLGSNYPINFCIDKLLEENKKNEIDKIFGIKNIFLDKKNIEIINENNDFFEYIMKFFFKFLFSINNSNKEYYIKYEIGLLTNSFNLSNFREPIINRQERINIINNSKIQAKQFIENYYMELNDINILL